MEGKMHAKFSFFFASTLGRLLHQQSVDYDNVLAVRELPIIALRVSVRLGIDHYDIDAVGSSPVPVLCIYTQWCCNLLRFGCELDDRRGL